MNSMHGTDKHAAPSGDHEKTICELWEDIELYARSLQRPAGNIIGMTYRETVIPVLDELEALEREEARLREEALIRAGRVVRDERPRPAPDFLAKLQSKSRA